MGDDLWFRRYQLVVGKQGGGKSIDNLADAPSLRLKFEVIKSLQKEPNHSTFKIYNLNDESVNLLRNVYTDLIFYAGHTGNVRLLFAGNTQFVNFYHDKADTICEIICGDGDQQFYQVNINKTFAKGTTDQQVVDYCLSQMSGITPGPIQLNSTGSLRGRSYSKLAHETLDEIARTNGCNWSIQNGSLHMVRADRMADPNAVATVLTADTGLLQAAERTSRGISATSLLNPSITVNSAVYLDNASIRTKLPKSSRSRAAANSLDGTPVKLADDGIYKVFKVRHSGDTHGNDFVTEIMCVAIGQPIPTTAVGTRDAVPNEGTGTGSVWDGVEKIPLIGGFIKGVVGGGKSS